MEAPSVSSEFDNEDKAWKSLSDKFDSAFSLEETASAFSKASQDANLEGEIPYGIRPCLSADEAHPSKGAIKCESSSKVIIDNDKVKSCYAHKKHSNASKLKKVSPSIGNNSSVAGTKMVWRVAGSNKTSDGTTPLKVASSSSSVHEEHRVWCIAGPNKTPNGTKPSRVKEKGFSVPGNASHKPLFSTDAFLDSSETSSSTSNASSDDDIEAFLFEMLGRGFQLERSTIREVLGNCGYDMKKSVEALLNLSAVQLDRRNNLSEGTHLQLNTKSFSSENQKQMQNSAQSNGSIFNLVASSLPKLGLLTAHLTATREVVTERDNAENFKSEATSLYFDYMKDNAEEGSYYTLRKAVKEHRETMKQYYQAAADAFAMGDRDRAILLLEKGQVFYNKAREADEESVSKILETSDGDDNGEDEVSLDLQDHDVKEAIHLVKVHLRTLSGIPLVRDLKINIGNGDRYAEKRKRLILKLLDRENIKWIEDESSGALLVRLEEINPKSLSFGRK